MSERPSDPMGSSNSLWSEIQETYRLNEKIAVSRFLSTSLFDPLQEEAIEKHATQLILSVRQHKSKNLRIESFLQTHQLSSQEGLALMSLAEALLRIPDKTTKTQLIREKISESAWLKTDQDTFFTRLTHFGLLASSRFLNFGLGSNRVIATLSSLIRRFGEPVIRQIMAQAMNVMSQQFIYG